MAFGRCQASRSSTAACTPEGTEGLPDASQAEMAFPDWSTPAKPASGLMTVLTFAAMTRRRNSPSRMDETMNSP